MAETGTDDPRLVRWGRVKAYTTPVQPSSPRVVSAPWWEGGVARFWALCIGLGVIVGIIAGVVVR